MERGSVIDAQIEYEHQRKAVDKSRFKNDMEERSRLAAMAIAIPRERFLLKWIKLEERP